LKYVLGVRIGKANELSKRPDLKMEVENHNEKLEVNKSKVG